MLKSRFIAPVVAIALSLAILVTASFNATAAAGEAGINYFIKPVLKDRILLVEPNLLSFVRADQPTDKASELLLDALSEIQENYVVNATRLVEVVRNNGKAIPNLFVYVQPADTIETAFSDVAVSDL
jgi:hypothetical protein